MGHVSGPLEFPPKEYLPEVRSGRFDDPLKEYRTLYCARHQTVALRESLQQFRHHVDTITSWKKVFKRDSLPAARVPDGWRAKRVLAPASIQLESGVELVHYEEPGLLRKLEQGFASILTSHRIRSLDIPGLRSKDRVVSQLFGRFLYEQGYGGIVFESGIPPGGVCVALFEGRASLDPCGPVQPLSGPLRSLRTVCSEFDLEL